MKIKTAELRRVVELVRPGLSGRKIVEQSDAIIFKGNRVFAYNDEVAVSAELPLRDDLAGMAGAVGAKQLFTFLDKSVDEEVDMRVEESHLRLDGKRARAGLRLETEIRAPIDQIRPPAKWNKIPAKFQEGIRFCSFSASQDLTKPVLTYVHVKGDRVEASDDFRLTTYTLPAAIKGELLIPCLAIPDLTLPGEEGYRYQLLGWGADEGWLHFAAAGHVLFSCRTCFESYPDVSALLDVEGEEVPLPAGLADALSRTGAFSETEFKQDERLEVTLTKGNLIVHARNDVGWYKERLPLTYTGPGLTFQVLPRFLSEALTSFELRSFVIGQDRLLMQGEGFAHVVGLLAGAEE